MEVAVAEEPQKKIFRARKTMKTSDRQQLEALHNTLTSSSSSSSSSSRPHTPLVNGTHAENGKKGKEKETNHKETDSKSPRSHSPLLTLALSRSPSPSKTEKEEPVTMDVDDGPASSPEEKSSKLSSPSSPSSPAQSAGLESDPDVKEGFLCLSEEDDVQGERDDMNDTKDEKMDSDSEKVKDEKDSPRPRSAAPDDSLPTGRKRGRAEEEEEEEEENGGKGAESERDEKRQKVEGVELEAQLELKITANAGSRLKLEKLVQQLVEERLRALQLTVFDQSLQELRERVEKIDCATKHQTTLNTLQAKIARLAKKFGAANQASENTKKTQEALAAAAAAKATSSANTAQNAQRTVKVTVDPKMNNQSPSATSSATPAQPKPLSTPATPTSSALASPAPPILQIISTTTSSTPSSSSTLTGQTQTGTLLLKTGPGTGVMTSSPATSGSQPVSIQPLLIQLPLAMANGQSGALVTTHNTAGGVGLIPVSSLATVNNLNKAKTTTPGTTFILQKTSATTSSTPSSLSSSSGQAAVARPVHQGGSGMISTPSAGVSVTTARVPTQCAAGIGVASASSSPATTGPAATGSGAVGPPSAAAMASKTDNQASNSVNKMPTQAARAKGSVIDLTEDDDDVQVTGVKKAPVPPSAINQRPSGQPPPLISSTPTGSTARSSPGQRVGNNSQLALNRSPMDSPSKSRPGSSSATSSSSSSSSSVTLPPLPLPPGIPVRLPPEAAQTSPPQQPQLKLARVQSQNGIVLSWCVAETDRNCAAVDSYHLYAYHQDHSANATQSLWKKIGEVKALPLPMACTLTQFVSGSTYYFAVRAKDVYGRFGPFCEPQCTDVISTSSS
ncbi:activating transcription factor 7-interacting protein 1 [Chanos chanos]|uniref:Activating transcription factor 7-interacting protein 1 n=1 Tax=Chanos chanos TaxID=29144 RepID=A0A6J2VW10_CHACN|nr:activating transcription factor 7-interacting protein 1 [Chanos chanos]